MNRSSSFSREDKILKFFYQIFLRSIKRRTSASKTEKSCPKIKQHFWRRRRSREYSSFYTKCCSTKVRKIRKILDINSILFRNLMLLTCTDQNGDNQVFKACFTSRHKVLWVLIPFSLAFQLVYACFIVVGKISIFVIQTSRPWKKGFDITGIFGIKFNIWFLETCLMKQCGANLTSEDKKKKHRAIQIKTCSGVAALLVTLINMFISGFMQSNMT